MGRGSVERRDECDEEAIPWRWYAVVDGGPGASLFSAFVLARSYHEPRTTTSRLYPSVSFDPLPRFECPVYGYIGVP